MEAHARIFLLELEYKFLEFTVEAFEKRAVRVDAELSRPYMHNFQYLHLERDRVPSKSLIGFLELILSRLCFVVLPSEINEEAIPVEVHAE